MFNERPARTVGAFTLVEVMVTLVILMVLMTLVFFAAAPSREQLKRVECASNLRQLTIASLGYATDFNGRWNNDRGGKNDHTTWISRNLYDYYKDEYAVNPMGFTCPNRGTDFVKFEPWPNFTRVRLGYYSFFGRRARDKWLRTTAWTKTVNGVDYHVEPIKIIGSMFERDGNSILMSDIVEVDTVYGVPNTATAGYRNFTNISHAPNGFVFSNSWGALPPKELGSEGVNAALLGGAVVWRRQDDLRYYSASSGGGVIGMY